MKFWGVAILRQDVVNILTEYTNISVLIHGNRTYIYVTPKRKLLCSSLPWQ